MLYQGIIGGGSSPVEPVDLSPVLLWTNPSPDTEFAAQTVSLDLSEYAGVLIESITSGIGSTTYIKKTEKGACGTIGSETGGGTARAATVSETNVVFSNAYALDTVTNTAARPTKIYGVKEYVVEPVGSISNWVKANYPINLSVNIGDEILLTSPWQPNITGVTEENKLIVEMFNYNVCHYRFKATSNTVTFTKPDSGSYATYCIANK